MTDTRGEDHETIRDQATEIERLEKVVGEQEEEIHQLMTKLSQLQGNFSHFHVDNEMNELCALCGLTVINAVHLRSR